MEPPPGEPHLKELQPSQVQVLFKSNKTPLLESDPSATGQSQGIPPDLPSKPACTLAPGLRRDVEAPQPPASCCRPGVLPLFTVPCQPQIPPTQQAAPLRTWAPSSEKDWGPSLFKVAECKVCLDSYLHHVVKIREYR